MVTALPGSSGRPPQGKRRGRRPGGGDTRAQLLDAARAAFAENGFEGATVRMIADRAGVDPAMVNHWFGGKDQLFVAALELPIDIGVILEKVVPGDPERLGERLATMFLTIWDATGGGPLAALIQSIAGHEAAARMMREFISTVLVGRVVSTVAPDRADLRATLTGSQIFGLGMARYVLKVEPLASADHATVINAMAPTLQRYLTGDIG